MSENKGPMKIEFAPGCFDTFDGTQEELDALMAEIQTMFETMTPEEIEAHSRPVDEELLEEMDEAEALELMQALAKSVNNRNLQ